MHCADEMTFVHNSFIRGLNAIVLQGPYVSPSSEADVTDFLFYIDTWTRTVDHHHHTEETVFFPGVEKLAGGSMSIMKESEDQHKGFHDGLEELGRYARETQPKDYQWETVKRIIDSFGEAMTKHLHEEIEVILSLDKYDSDGLKECWLETERVAKADFNMGIMVSCPYSQWSFVSVPFG